MAVGIFGGLPLVSAAVKNEDDDGFFVVVAVLGRSNVRPFFGSSRSESVAAGSKITKDDDGGFFLSLLLLVGAKFIVEMYLLVVLLMMRSGVVLTCYLWSMSTEKENERTESIFGENSKKIRHSFFALNQYLWMQVQVRLTITNIMRTTSTRIIAGCCYYCSVLM